MNLEECLSIVQDVSHVTSRSQDPPTLSSNLFRLLPCLESSNLTVTDLSLLRHKIWQNDLIHLVIEVLRGDHSNDCRTLTNLVVMLTSVVAGLTPKEPRYQKPSSSNTAQVEQVREYYDILLPTATDSILIVASNMLEALDQVEPEPDFPECFKKVVDSLLWLCSGHKQCIPRALNSPYLLSLLITDHYLYSHVVLSALETLIVTEKSSAANIPQDVLTSILDELVYKLSGNDKDGASLSLRVLALLSISLPGLIDTLNNSYAGLLTLAEKWVQKDQELGAAEKYLIAELESRADGQGEVDEKHKAAIFIQASWRGYASRKKMVAAKRGIMRFQQLYRKRKSEKLVRRATQEKTEMKVTLQQTYLKTSQLAFHTKQLSQYEQLPASELQEFILKEENMAAARIQSTWRGFSARSQYKELKSKSILVKSVTVIQRAFRRHSRAKQVKISKKEHDHLPKLSTPVREKLQREVASYRDTHPPSYRTPEQVSALHKQAQQEYEKFCFTQALHTRRDEEIRQLVSKLNRNCELMLSAPSLQESVGVKGIEDTYCSRSSAVAVMARTAHREELKAMDTPWWKRTPLDQEELNL